MTHNPIKINPPAPNPIAEYKNAQGPDVAKEKHEKLPLLYC